MKAQVLLVVVAACSAFAQGTFQNLDFEQARVNDLPYPSVGELVSITDGVPSWSISPSIGSDMLHNSLPLGGAAVVVLGPTWPSNDILDGKYTVWLIGSSAGPPTLPAIFQTGQIPPGTASILFYGAGVFSLSLGGQPIPLVDLGTAPNFTLFGGDVSAFAGQTAELRFEGGGVLDNIVFSSQVIPEPSVLGLLAFGSVFLMWRNLRSLSYKSHGAAGKVSAVSRF